MMKKLVTFMLAVVMVATLLPTQAFAANFYQDDSEVVYEKTWKCDGEDAEDKILEYCRNYVANERTDEYALRYFSFHPSIDWASVYPEQYKVMKEITKGITSDFEKVKAIAKWVSSNMTYDSTNDADDSLAAAGIPKWLRGTCSQYADTTMLLLRLAGFPAKKIIGRASMFEHAWNHVFIEGHWYSLDTQVGLKGHYKLLLTTEAYSLAYYITYAPEATWDGTLTIKRTTDALPISTIGPVPIFTTIDKIPELKGMNLYMDRDCTKPVDPKVWKYDIDTTELFVKTYRVSFEIQLDNAYKSLVPHFVREDEDGGLYAYITVPEGAKLPQVKLPKKAGYTFIGWRDLNNSKAPIWNEYTDKVTKDMSFVAVFKKGTVNYTVRFNTNGGSAVKAVTVKANTKVTKPANPTKSGYKFTGWYLDKKCTEAWDFSKHIVRRNTTLYAGWKKVITAKPGELAKGDGKAKVAKPTTSKIYKNLAESPRL